MTLDLRPVLHRACQQISPIHPDYAMRPIQDGFSWSSSLTGCAFDRLYLVVFRSVRRRTADLDLLREHDDRAHEKALESGGLLRYFKGEANERGERLSFWLGETRRKAIDVTSPPVSWAPNALYQYACSSVACMASSVSHRVTESILPSSLSPKSQLPQKPLCILSDGPMCSSTACSASSWLSGGTAYSLTRAYTVDHSPFSSAHGTHYAIAPGAPGRPRALFIQPRRR